MLLGDALSAHKGRPWDGASDWKDFCRRSFQLCKNWEGNGRVVPRLITPPGSDIHRIKVDEKVGICITTRLLGGLVVTHLFSGITLWSLPPFYVRARAHCEYENGYLVFDRFDGKKEVWRLASDFAVGSEVATHSPPDQEQTRIAGLGAAMHPQYESLGGHFWPWAMLSFSEITLAYRFAYPTLLCANKSHAFLHDLRTGALVQTIDMDLQSISYVDVNERHAFVCELDALHVFSRSGGGAEVLRIPKTVLFSNVAFTTVAPPGNPFVQVLQLRPGGDDHHPSFMAAHVSRDGRDLVISTASRVLLVRDFERICRGEITLSAAGQVLHFLQRDLCFYLAFEHGRVCVATFLGLYVFNVDRGPSIDSARVVFVRPYVEDAQRSHAMTCMQLTDRRIYFTWEDASRKDVPLFKDEEDVSQTSLGTDEPSDEPSRWPWITPFDPLGGVSVGCIDFSLLPES